MGFGTATTRTLNTRRLSILVSFRMRTLMLIASAALALLPIAVHALQPVATKTTDARPPDPTTPIPRDDPRWLARHQSYNDRAAQGHAQGDIDLIFLGDSITQQWEDAGREVWNKHFQPRHAVNFGISGDRTQHLLWRLQHGNLDGLAQPLKGDAPRLAIIMIGTNNTDTDTPAQIAAGIRAVTETVREKLPATEILLLAVFPRAEQPLDPLRTKIVRINELLAAETFTGLVKFLDINDVFFEAGAKQPRTKSLPTPTFVQLRDWTAAQGMVSALYEPSAEAVGVPPSPTLPWRLKTVRAEHGYYTLLATPTDPSPAVMLTASSLMNGKALEPRRDRVFRASSSGTLESAAVWKQGRFEPVSIEEVASDFQQTLAALQRSYQDHTLHAAITPDFLHLSAKGYECWWQALEPHIAKVLHEPDPAAPSP